MDVLLSTTLIAVFVLNIIAAVWDTRIQSQDTMKKTQIIFLLYKELKRHNDLLERDRNESDNQ